MKKQYRKKPVVIEAEQFFKDKELPEGVIRKRFEDYQDPAPYYKYGI